MRSQVSPIIFISGTLLMLLGMSSCGDTREIRETFSMHFQPRECSQIITLPLRYKEIPGTAGNKHFVTKTTEMLEDGAVEADRFILWMMTGEDDLKELRAEYPNLKSKEYENVYETYHTMKERELKAPHMRPLEQQLEHDYRSYISSTRALSTSSDSKATAYPRPWPYRVTGVKDFRIISLSPLFGKPAESSLNDYFTIDEFRPRQIISYRRKALLWGYSDKDKEHSAVALDGADGTACGDVPLEESPRGATHQDQAGLHPRDHGGQGTA